MSSKIARKRTWCKTCQDFSIFTTTMGSTEEGKLSTTACDTCESDEMSYTLTEVPEEKLIEQRARYNDQRRQQFMSMLNIYYKGLSKNNILADMLREPGHDLSETDVKEDGAGQEAIDEAIKAEREADRLADIEFKEKYHGAQRNDKCRCESGLKYKKCCLSKVEKIR
jgi:hypothetical protein